MIPVRPDFVYPSFIHSNMTVSVEGHPVHMEILFLIKRLQNQLLWMIKDKIQV